MISKEFIPLKAKNWVEKIQMYGAMCQGMEGLSIKKYVEEGLAREINLDAADSYFMAIKRVTGKLQKIYHCFGNGSNSSSWSLQRESILRTLQGGWTNLPSWQSST